jgi:hypothetical protein
LQDSQMSDQAILPIFVLVAVTDKDSWYCHGLSDPKMPLAAPLGLQSAACRWIT